VQIGKFFVAWFQKCNATMQLECLKKAVQKFLQILLSLIGFFLLEINTILKINVLLDVKKSVFKNTDNATHF
jgi:hypothetical protein